MSGVKAIQHKKNNEGLGKISIWSTLERAASAQALDGIVRTVENFSKRLTAPAGTGKAWRTSPAGDCGG